MSRRVGMWSCHWVASVSQTRPIIWDDEKYKSCEEAIRTNDYQEKGAHHTFEDIEDYIELIDEEIKDDI